MRLVYLGLLILTLISGCVSVNSVRYENISRIAKSVDYPIDIYDLKDIKQPYKVIGIVETKPGSLTEPINKVLDKFREEARKMGGDALIDLKKDSQPVGMVSAGTGILTQRIAWTAKVIVWEGN